MRSRTHPRLACRLAAALAMLLAATAAAPQAGSPTVREMTAAVAEWVAAELGTAPPARLPRLEFADAGRMRALRYGDRASAQAAPLEVLALYDDKAGTILLREGWTGTTPTEMSVLVHEMVHHFQNREARAFECERAREAEAYALQDRWLRLYGESLESAFALNRLAVLVLTSCAF
jgi:hypothetical protein